MSTGPRRAGIVMLLYNRADVALPCLRSLASARSETPWELFLLDNGSRAEESAPVRELFDQLVRDGSIEGRFVRSEENLGFPAGNNVGIRHFLERDDLTHICLMNSDVLITDGWLDRLLERDEADAVGPVTNACGNEQTVPVGRQHIPGERDFDPERALADANLWSEGRRQHLRGRAQETPFLGFFCFLARIEVFYDVGFLDERFGRGAYEDDDFCRRLLERGYRMFVARDVFVYHFGGQSFREVPRREFHRSIAHNRRLFEEKHGEDWADRSLLPLWGAWGDVQDMAGALGDYETAMVEQHATQSEGLVRELLWKRERDGFLRRMASALERRRKLLRAWWQRRSLHRFALLMKRLVVGRPVFVLGRRFPDEEDLNDGYFQRVRLIDGLLEDHCRIYLRTENVRRKNPLPPVLEGKGLRRYELAVRPSFPLDVLAALIVGLFCRRVYVHSVLRFDVPLARWLYKLARVRVLDVHGSVPEEFEYEGNEGGARIFGAYERFAVEQASMLVVVSQAMGEHLTAKYGRDESRPILCVSMLPEAGRNAAASGDAAPRAGAVYAGGLHPWQQVDEMLAYARAHAGELAFTFLVTDPARVQADWDAQYGAPAPRILRVPASEVAAEYAQHAFGLVFREPVVLNAVACPTKLVEYLQHGLLPIVDTPHIGDFERLGYRYVGAGDPLPGEEERRAMVRENDAVVRRLYLAFLLGAEDLKAALRGRRPGSCSPRAGLLPEALPKDGA